MIIHLDAHFLLESIPDPIDRQVLIALYDSHYHSPHAPLPLSSLAATLDLSETEMYRRHLMPLIEEEYFVCEAGDRNFQLKPAGEKYIEANQLSTACLATITLRGRIAVEVVNACNADQNDDQRVTIVALRDRLSLPMFLVERCAHFLVYFDHLEELGKSAFRPTARTRHLATTYRQAQGLQSDFMSLKGSNDHHHRGRLFDSLVSNVLKHQGWDAHEKDRLAGEENDVVAALDTEFVILQCKWEASPQEPKTLREFYGKLTTRTPGSTGVLLSMSGFTSGCSDYASRLNERLMLLFGPKDIERMVMAESTFLDQLRVKKRQAIWRNDFRWE